MFDGAMPINEYDKQSVWNRLSFLWFGWTSNMAIIFTILFYKIMKRTKWYYVKYWQMLE